MRARLMSAVVARLAVAGLFLGAGSVRASERGAALNWVRLSGAGACIGAVELAERVEQRLERSVFVVDSAALLSVDGSVQPLASGFAVRLALSDRAGQVLGERALQSADADCRKLDEAIVLVIALTLSPGQALFPDGGIALNATTERLLHELFQHEPTELNPNELQASVGSEASAAMIPAPPTAAHPAPRRGRPATEPRHMAVNASVAAILGLGLLPGAAPGIELALTLVPVDSWAWRLAAAYLPEQTRRAVTLSSGATGFDLSQAAVGVCPWQTDDGRLRMQLCTGLGLSLLRVVASGYAEGSGRRVDPILDGQAQFDLQLRFWGPALLQLGAGLAVPFIQHSYAYQGLDAQPKPLFRTSPASGRVGIGLGVGF
jgi:hypothetical protein